MGRQRGAFRPAFFVSIFSKREYLRNLCSERHKEIFVALPKMQSGLIRTMPLFLILLKPWSARDVLAFFLSEIYHLKLWRQVVLSREVGCYSDCISVHIWLPRKSITIQMSIRIFDSNWFSRQSYMYRYIDQINILLLKIYSNTIDIWALPTVEIFR